MAMVHTPVTWLGEMVSGRPKEECGVFGISVPGIEAVRQIYFGLFALQHRGQESAGIAVTDGHGITLRKGLGLVSQVFQDEKQLTLLRGAMGIGHVRYSTTGSTSERNAQPLLAVASSSAHKSKEQLNLVFQESRDGVQYVKNAELALAHNGNIVNAAELRERLESDNYSFETTTDTEVITHLIEHNLGGVSATKATAKVLFNAIRKTLGSIKGAYALVIMTPTFLVGARDPRGIRPLVLGSSPDSGGHVFASETCALNIIGARFVREVEPGECILIDYVGRPPTSARIMNSRKQPPALCLFEAVYFARPDSMFYGFVVEESRERMGSILAREHPVNADIVVPIPDSGLPASLGYAEASGIKYVPALIKNRYVLRTFIEPDQRLRDQGIKLKLNPLRTKILGKRIVLVDDSIVRGTTTRQIVRLLKETGATEVHLRISCPPIKWPCYYGIDTSCRTDLIASKMTKPQILKYVGADSLEYLSLEGLLEAAQKDAKNGYCDACLTGRYPVRVPKEYGGKLALE